MLRAGLDPDSPYAAVLVLPNGGLAFQHRDRADQATTYWRKLAALRPKDTRYQRLLAHRLAERGLRDEAMSIYDRLLEQAPDESLTNYNEIQLIYKGPRIIPLAERLLAWKPGVSASPYGPRVNQGYAFAQVAQECATQKRPDLVIALCRRGIELDAAVGGQNQELFKLLVTTLLEQGRRDEARDALIANFVPAAGPTPAASSVSPTQLGFRNPVFSRYNRSSWMSSISWSGDSVDLSELQPLEDARPPACCRPCATPWRRAGRRTRKGSSTPTSTGC